MAKYQVAIINRPADWEPESADDVPLELNGRVGVLTESDNLFEAVDRAMEHNERRGSPEPRSLGRRRRTGERGSHLACRPLVYAAYL